jgi:hypothetical protein
MYEPDWDKVADANDPDVSSELGNSYIVRGTGRWGGCQDVQTKLGEYGVCRFTRWDPRPPFWSFLYDTHLAKHQVLVVLGSSKDRNQVTVE